MSVVYRAVRNFWCGAGRFSVGDLYTGGADAEDLMRSGLLEIVSEGFEAVAAQPESVAAEASVADEKPKAKKKLKKS